MSNERALRESILQVASIAEVCIHQKALLPALILIYSGIDTMGWLVADDESAAVVDRFASWVDKYMLGTKSLDCTSLDLYAARCGILHTFTADSRLSATGKARPIYYVWGKVSAEDHARVAGATREKCVFLRVEDLSEAFRRGVAKTVEVATTDGALSDRMLSKAGKFFLSIPTNELLGRPDTQPGAP